MNPPKRRGCVSVIGYLAILFAASLVGTPQGAPATSNRNQPAFEASQAEPAGVPALPGAPLGVSAPSHASGDTAHASVPPSGAPESVLASPSGEPQGEVGTALIAGYATWCAPTATQCQSWAPPALLGAMPSFRWGDAPFPARVCRDDGTACVTVTVTSFCDCGDRHGLPTVIDLSPAAMYELEPDYRRLGVLRVNVEWPLPTADDVMRDEVRDDPAVTLPPTDAAP